MSMAMRKEYDGVIRDVYSNDESMFYSAETALECKDESLTVQSQAEEADINTIVKRFGVTGMLPLVERPPLNEDFTEVFDFRSAMDMILAAQRSFEGLDANVRKRFGNDPAEFVEFCGNPDNLDEMRKMGLAVPKVDPPVSSEPSVPATE